MPIQSTTSNIHRSLFHMILNLTILFRLGVIRSVILLFTIGKELPGAATKTVQPEEIETLKRSQQRERDNHRDPALILLRFPVKFIRAHRPELNKDRIKDLQIEIMSQIDPRNHIQGVKGYHEIGPSVVERLREL